MQIEPIDPVAVDDETWQQVAEVTNSELVADVPSEAPVTAESAQSEALFTFEDRPYDGYWLARDGDRVVGWASLGLATWDNLDQAMVFCSVSPKARGQGVGKALLQAQVDGASRAGRTKLMTFVYRDTPTQALLTANGFAVGQLNAQRRLLPAEIDYSALQRLTDEAAVRARDYELLQLCGPTPEEWLPQLATLSEGINDAPIDDLDIEPDSISPERLRQGERALAKRGQVVYRIVARHRKSGEWAAHTVLCADHFRPGLGHQEDTTVLRHHRGHRLGLLLKASMLLWMRAAEPGLTEINTWNAESNTHMIAVNEQLGCHVSNLSCVMQRHL